ADGEIYTWGNLWTSSTMGQGANPSPGTGLITEPTRIGDRDNWVFISFRGNNAAAINEHGHLYTWGPNASGQLGVGDTAARSVPTRVGNRSDWALISVCNTVTAGITEGGYLFTWGPNAQGQLGLGVTGGGNRTTPQRVGAATNWESVGISSNAVFAINSSNELFSWGTNQHGQLGHGDTNQRNSPTRVGTASNWISVVAGAVDGFGTTVAINSDGELFSWGANNFDRLGRVANVANPANRPGRVGTGSNWAAIGGGNSHFLAITECLRLYAWGNNANGQLGIGTVGSHASTPTFVLRAYGFAGFSQSGGGSHSMMLVRTELEGPREQSLTKTLELSEGTTLPAPPPSFEFNFEPVQVQVQTNPPVNSWLPAGFDDVVTNPQSITIDASTGAGIPRTYTGYLDLWELFYDLADAGDFPGGGVFAWNVSEVDGSSNTVPPLFMTYDVSRYQVWVWIESDGSLYDIRIFPIIESENGEDDDYTLGPKAEHINFRNTLTRQINRALEISKTVTAGHDRPYLVNFQQLFSFTLMLTGANVPASLEATIVNTTTQAAVTGGRNPVAITGGSATFQLRHNETLQIPPLPPGTSFAVSESAHRDFAPELAVILDGVEVHTASALANNNLPSGTHTLTTGTGRNAVDFENVHQYVPITGFTLSDIPLLVAALPLLALIAYAALRNRKEKEELSL
ncbi:MAG: hypothetical protein FWE48_05415, partial [Coriobacteriia bacterium]|nr:hypothetical protein [Coriobacteriia bacterium]